MKIDKRKPSFSIGQIKWINNRGFNTATYDWSNSEINDHLKKSVRGRNTSRALLIVSPIVMWVGSLIMIAPLMDDNPDNNSFLPTGAVFAVTGGLMFYGSFAINLTSRNKVKKANKLRLRLSK